MDRRTFLRRGAIATTLLGGCVAVPERDPPPGGRTVSIVETDGAIGIPIEPSIAVVGAGPTATAPPRLRATVTNTADVPLEVGEERAVVFAYVHSQERPGILLLPESADRYEAVRPGCFRLAEPIFVAEYYGILRLRPGESTAATLGVWGSPDLERGCLPTGRFRFLTTYTAARDRTDDLDAPEFTARWGFTLSVTT